ncbi:hypothetical protein I7I48_00400 [Histoplasma ohiense]|nr:hypothetical protein I7I48_00400 [Histoplasma ohiense (nom. inval.)]
MKEFHEGFCQGSLTPRYTKVPKVVLLPTIS